MWTKANFDQISKFHFLKFWQTNSIMWTSFHLNGHIIGFRPQTQKLESPYKTASSTLAVKGLKITCYGYRLERAHPVQKKTQMVYFFKKIIPGPSRLKTTVYPWGLLAKYLFGATKREFSLSATTLNCHWKWDLRQTLYGTGALGAKW